MIDELDLAAYDYPLDPARVAQHPPPSRGASRLLVLDRASDAIEVRPFADFPGLLDATDLVVLNDARVRAARFVGRTSTGGKVELLLLGTDAPGRWRAMAKVGRALRPGETLVLEDGRATMTVVGRDVGTWLLDGPAGWADVEPFGRAPLPPYIRREADDPHRARDLDRYQTVYATAPGAIAAPTAGLHLTDEHFAAMAQRGIEVVRVTLEVGPGTFLPVKASRVDHHAMHAERWRVGPDAALALTRARDAGRRVVAIGTTSCRVLETLAREQAPPYREAEGTTTLFLHPPHAPTLTGALVTNFHLPRSTLLMLVSAMAGRERILAAYARAQREGLAFHSYGDAMFIR